MVPRNFLPYLTKVFHPKVLKFLGKAAPWKTLNRVIELADMMHANAREIYETKKRLLESGDSTTVKQVGDGKDIMSVLSASTELHFTIAGLIFSHRSPSQCCGIRRRSTKRRGSACSNEVCHQLVFKRNAEE